MPDLALSAFVCAVGVRFTPWHAFPFLPPGVGFRPCPCASAAHAVLLFAYALHFRRRDDNICRLAQGKCAAEEVNITIVHVKGAMCSPVCGVMDSCPKDVPAGVTVVHALLFPSLTSVECCSPSSAAQHACQSRIRLREHIRRPTRSVRCRTWPGASFAPSSAACRCRFSTRYERCLG